VRIVVGSEAGSAPDVIARSLAKELEPLLRQPVVIDNRAGAAGTVGAAAVAQAPADGYTLFMVSLAQMSIVPHMQKVRYDPFRSFTPISVASTSVFALGVSNNFPGKTLQELIAYVKARPGQVAYGSSGTGSAGHLTMELFAKRAGITMTHIPYKGVAPAIGDLIGGHVPMVFGSVSEILRPYKAGKLRVVGVSSDKRLSQMPEVPTVAEQGFPGYQITTWNGLVAPAATPREVINTVLGALTPACKDAAFVARFQAIDADAWCSTPAEFAEMLKADYIKWGDAVKAAGVTAN
jgi:tripartite-type tricarboxylate transporter receptor subunit TctC